MRTVIAMGGGGFSTGPDNLLLEKYVLDQSASRSPKICFIPTASGDSQQEIDMFYKAFGAFACAPSHLSLFRPDNADRRSLVFDQDIVYVGGGNTKNMLALWREWGLDVILREAYAAGTVLAGVSAGSICWFEEGVTDSLPGALSPIGCLGILKGSNCPHYDSEAERRPAYHRLVASGGVLPGIAADDGVALHYVDEVLHAVVSSNPLGSAYMVNKSGESATETPVAVVQLKS